MVLEVRFNTASPRIISNTIARKSDNSRCLYAGVSFGEIAGNFVTRGRKSLVNIVEGAMRKNPAIQEFLDKNGLLIDDKSIKALEKLETGHLSRTTDILTKMLEYSPLELTSLLRKKELVEAAGVHDFGKLGIPSSILNKKGPLTDDEWKKMDLHSQLGSMFLGTFISNLYTIKYAKFHHLTKQGKIHPNVKKSLLHDPNLQYIYMADFYDALTSNRSYRKALSREVSLGIIKKEVEKYELNMAVYKTLEDSTLAYPQREAVYLQFVNRLSSILPKRHERRTLNLAG